MGPGLQPLARAFTPLIAKPVCGSNPKLRKKSTTLAEVFTSLKPNSGSSAMLLARASISAALSSMAAQTFTFNKSLSTITPLFKNQCNSLLVKYFLSVNYSTSIHKLQTVSYFYTQQAPSTNLLQYFYFHNHCAVLKYS